MAPTVELSLAPSPDDRAAILSGLVTFNDRAFGPSDIAPLAVLIRDDAGAVVGGLWGRTTYGFLYVELLFVPESLRGQAFGARLMAEAEVEARTRGATGAWVDCFGAANRRFYEARGYAAFGALPGMPPGHERYFLNKRL